MAGRSRLRPVLMTALTTMLAMLPLALSKGEGAEIWSPMGITLIGGLIFFHLGYPDCGTTGLCRFRQKGATGQTTEGAEKVRFYE